MNALPNVILGAKEVTSGEARHTYIHTYYMLYVWGNKYMSYYRETEWTIPLGKHRHRWEDNASIWT
jgi:hypothetical protein